MNIVYKKLDSLAVLEQLPDNEYDFIYLDVPYCIGIDFVYISKEDRKEKVRQYSSYISKIIENTYRILKSDGIIAFLAPGKEYVDINYKLLLDQFFPSSMNVTIETRKISSSVNSHNNSILYFYSKELYYEFPILKELRPIEEFSYKDERDYYNKISLLRTGSYRPNFSFVWHGIMPPANKYWSCSSDKLDQLFDEGRIIIDKDNAFLKWYRREHPITVSSVWRYNDSTGTRSSIDTQSINRMFSMFVNKNSNILCPFDRDGKFSLVADKEGINWTSIFLSAQEEKRTLFPDIPTNHYVVISELINKVRRSYKTDIVTNTEDISTLQKRVNQLTENVKKIQMSIGIDDESEASVEQVIDQIHKQISDAISPLSIDEYISKAQEWLKPYWNQLEPESKHFIPTGILLYNQFNKTVDIDMAPIMIEYCKSLEIEIFKKMFFGYIQNLIEREVDIKDKFSEDLKKSNMKVFAKFLTECTTKNKNNPDKWRFEIGKMKFVLQSTLATNPEDSITRDFRDYLNRVYDQQFFRERFIEQLDTVTKLRNNCAHPSIIDNNTVEEVKEIIRKKLLLILKYYTG